VNENLGFITCGEHSLRDLFGAHSFWVEVHEHVLFVVAGTDLDNPTQLA
jgi:hypothetical protein